MKEIKLPDIEANKQAFIKIATENIAREGINKLLAWLEKTDFYTAPASTRFHGDYEGGLCEHSLNVYNTLNKLCADYEITEFTPETIAIIALFHDICKVKFYKRDFRNVKNEETGKWEKQEVWAIDEALPLGHGEKSCILVQGCMPLNVNELLAIRWHMAGYDKGVIGGDSLTISNAAAKTKLVGLLQCADMIASQLLEFSAEDIK